MEFSNVSHQFVTLDDGSCKYMCCGEWDCYSYVMVLLLRSKTSPHPIPNTTSLKFMQTLANNHLDFEIQVKKLPDPNGPPYYKISPTTRPQHRFTLDSCTFDECGVFKPSHNSFGGEDEGPESVRVRSLLTRMTPSYAKTYVSWLCDGQNVGKQMFLQIDLYDLRATQFVHGKYGRVWAHERTMTRMLMRELEELISGPKVNYRGVRWRPERKHPWVVELRIPKKKKMWIGAFRTQEDAARAYDVAAIAHGKLTALNFPESYQQLFHKPLEISKTSNSEQQVVTADSSALNKVPTNLRNPPDSDNDDPKLSGANRVRELGHDFDESVSAGTANLDKDPALTLPISKLLNPQQRRNLHNVQEVGIQPCYMFAKDLPIIGDDSLTLYNPDRLLMKENTLAD